MKDNFIKVAAITPDIRVGDTEYNADSIIKDIEIASENGVACRISRALYNWLYMWRFVFAGHAS